jgi:hypothetical protein
VFLDISRTTLQILIAVGAALMSHQCELLYIGRSYTQPGGLVYVHKICVYVCMPVNKCVPACKCIWHQGGSEYEYIHINQEIELTSQGPNLMHCQIPDRKIKNSIF